jgi:hypothetical protein
MLSNYVTALIRTLAAALVGWLLSLPLAHPVLELLGLTDASPASKEKAVAFLTVVLTAAYYAAAHALEKRWPQLSVLLGSTKQPVAYAPAADGTAVITSLGSAPSGVLPPDTDLNGGPAGQHAAPDSTSNSETTGVPQ